MTSILQIDNFKCFRKQQIEFADLTALVGANGAGKSSVMQSLLLLRLSIENPVANELQLNGPYGLCLGMDGSIGNNSIATGVTKLSMKSGGQLYKLQLKAQSLEENLSIHVANKSELAYRKDFFAKEFYYLSADRTGPRVCQTMRSLPYVHTGIYGEHAAQILAQPYIKIDKQRMYPKSMDNSIGKQTNLWLSSILPGVEVKATANASMQVAQVLIKNGVTNDFLTSPNIGYGISYALPIILTGLIARRGSYMLVENPEAHLHPSAQSAMGQFLAMLSQNGVRMVVETHSDHVLDGIRIYATQHKISLKSVMIHNFEIQNGAVRVESIKYTNKYTYDKWPKGFRDQSSSDYLEYYQAIQK